MKEIAKSRGLPVDGAVAVQAFRKLLAQTITKNGSMYLAAKELGIVPAQLNLWANDLEIERRVQRSTTAHTVAVLREKA